MLVLSSPAAAAGRSLPLLAEHQQGGLPAQDLGVAGHL